MLICGRMLIVITAPTAVPKEHVLAAQLFDRGLRRLHIRKPEWSEQSIVQFVHRLDRYRDRIVLHGSPSLASRLRVRGLHYTERSRPQAPLAQPATGLSVSTSFHSLQQLHTDWGPALRYAFLSPIFDSVSKEGYAAADFDRGEVRDALAACSFPVVALGGITAANLPEIKALGFAGAAVIGSVWQADDPVAAFEELQEAGGGEQQTVF